VYALFVEGRGCSVEATNLFDLRIERLRILIPFVVEPIVAQMRLQISLVQDAPTPRDEEKWCPRFPV